MRLLYFSKYFTNYGWGAERHMAAALAAQGVDLVHVDYQKCCGRVAGEVARLEREFDGVLVQRGRGYLFPMAVLNAIKRPKVLLFTELVRRNLDQSALFVDNPFDRYFVRTGACKDMLVEKFGLSAADISIFLSSAPDLSTAPRGGAERNIGVLFCGGLTPRRARLLEGLEKSVGVTRVATFGDEMFDYLRKSKIVLNLHASDHLDTETRVFEVLAAGALLVTERLSPESPFRSGTHLIETETAGEMAEAVCYFLAHEAERESIAMKGWDEVRRNHLYAARAEVLRAAFGELIPASGPAGQPIASWAFFRAGMRERLDYAVPRLRMLAGKVLRHVSGGTKPV